MSESHVVWQFMSGQFRPTIKCNDFRTAVHLADMSDVEAIVLDATGNVVHGSY